MELLANGPVLLGNGLIAIVLGLFMYMWRLDRNWMRESLKEMSERIDRYAAEAKSERENLSALLLQVAERTARIEGWQQGRAEIRLESRLQELIKEYGVASSAASD